MTGLMALEREYSLVISIRIMQFINAAFLITLGVLIESYTQLDEQSLLVRAVVYVPVVLGFAYTHFSLRLLARVFKEAKARAV